MGKDFTETLENVHEQVQDHIGKAQEQVHAFGNSFWEWGQGLQKNVPWTSTFAIGATTSKVDANQEDCHAGSMAAESGYEVLTSSVFAGSSCSAEAAGQLQPVQLQPQP